MEIDKSDPEFQKKSIRAALMKDDSLTHLLSAEDFQTVNAFFTDSLGIPLKALDRMKPLMLAEMPVLMRIPKTKSYEEEFLQMARDQQKEVLGISTIDKETKCLDGISLDVQAQMLVESVDPEIIREDKIRRRKVMKLYEDGDITAIFQTMKGKMDEYEGVYEAMFPSRHAIWIPSMKALMQEHSCFFAVGVGHLAGPDGLIELLQMEGYTLIPLQ